MLFSKKKYTEKEIVSGCVKNDRFFQELLYRRYFPAMMGMCMKHTQDREAAMHILNNGFLKVFKKIDQFSFKGSLEGWIRRIVFHSLSDYFKKESRYIQFLVLEDRDFSFSDHTLETIYAEDLLKIVDTLPPATREVFRMFAIEGFSHKEIAETLDISEGTSKWHLSAARKLLKQKLSQSNSKSKYAG